MPWHALLLLLQFLAWWTALSILAALWLAVAGNRLSRKQESERFAWDKPLRFLELSPDEYERDETPLGRARRVM